MIKKNLKGQSFIELMAALLIVSFVLVALVTLVTKSISNTTFSRNKSLATSYTQEGLEWLRGVRDSSWNTFYSYTNTPWCLPVLAWTGGSHVGSCNTGDAIPGTIFLRRVNFTRVNGSTVNTTITVSWTDGNGTHESVSSTTLTNWKGNP